MSLKKHGLANEKRSTNEVPLIADEIDISPWKNLLMKFSQVHVCLEHLYRAENCLRADFGLYFFFALVKQIFSRNLIYRHNLKGTSLAGFRVLLTAR